MQAGEKLSVNENAMLTEAWSNLTTLVLNRLSSTQ